MHCMKIRKKKRKYKFLYISIAKSLFHFSDEVPFRLSGRREILLFWWQTLLYRYIRKIIAIVLTAICIINAFILGNNCVHLSVNDWTYILFCWLDLYCSWVWKEYFRENRISVSQLDGNSVHSAVIILLPVVLLCR
jgi:hypothetical protein